MSILPGILSAAREEFSHSVCRLCYPHSQLGLNLHSGRRPDNWHALFGDVRIVEPFASMIAVTGRQALVRL